MSDFARFLPLNGRPHGDEAAVSSDRRAALADVVAEAAHLLERTELPRRAELAAAFTADARLDLDPTALSAAADHVRAGRRRSIRSLARATRALLVLGEAVGAAPELSAATTGAVALYGATSGPFDRRAVLKGRTVAATDADWSFGRGPTVSAPALQIVAFVLGVSDTPPTAPRA
ncbi:hypothetical protein ACFQRL_07415 [Microbacterium fluvii]|uniref:Uncharacterized protein n=1 Tax=Microbacterium fluvii TaxID=415215 RepID=A0ABW2HCJ4_9MICO|nr:hypothetical protein [Microbacterium fluvii]MCU4672414.1 hypothetical protein [Microbacterium fluvii]